MPRPRPTSRSLNAGGTVLVGNVNAGGTVLLASGELTCGRTGKGNTITAKSAIELQQGRG